MKCDFEITKEPDGKYKHTCRRCNKILIRNVPTLVAQCDVLDTSPKIENLEIKTENLGIKPKPCNCGDKSPEAQAIRLKEIQRLKDQKLK